VRDKVPGRRRRGVAGGSVGLAEYPQQRLAGAAQAVVDPPVPAVRLDGPAALSRERWAETAPGGETQLPGELRGRHE
jgi:hypothetical protein